MSLNYMVAIEIAADIDIKKLSKNLYLDTEEALIQYASGIGYPVGCVDWAIWIVMRVAKKEGYI